MNREEFYSRVRQAVRQGQAYRIAVPDGLPQRPGYVGGGDDLPARMAAEVDGSGGVAHLVDDLRAARGVVARLLDQHQPRTALCWQHPLLERLELATLLTERGVAAVSFDPLSELEPQDAREGMLAADIGITSATYAVAETGTLAMASGPGSERAASLLPPFHVAVVESAQILPDLFDLFDRLEDVAVEMPSNLTLITGPSKTGDLELQLTTGVHGPGEWHVVVVR